MSARQLQLHDDRFRGFQHLHAFRQRQFLDVNRGAEREVGDVDADSFRDVAKWALDVQCVQRLVEHATTGGLRCVPQFHRNGDADEFRPVLALEVHVNHLLAEIVPLEFADEHGFGFAADFQVEHAGVLNADCTVEFLGGNGDLDIVLLVAVHDARNLSRFKRLDGSTGAAFGARVGLEGNDQRHACTSRDELLSPGPHALLPSQISHETGNDRKRPIRGSLRFAKEIMAGGRQTDKPATEKPSITVGSDQVCGTSQSLASRAWVMSPPSSASCGTYRVLPFPCR